jgi:hypothetical protein
VKRRYDFTSSVCRLDRPDAVTASARPLAITQNDRFPGKMRQRGIGSEKCEIFGIKIAHERAYFRRCEYMCQIKS